MGLELFGSSELGPRELLRRDVPERTVRPDPIVGRPPSASVCCVSARFRNQCHSSTRPAASPETLHARALDGLPTVDKVEPHALLPSSHS